MRSKPRLPLLSALLLLAFPMALAAQTTERGTTYGTTIATAPGVNRIVAGLSVKVQLDHALNSATAREGDQWDGVLAADLIVAGHLTTPVGTPVTGVVSKVMCSAKSHLPGVLELRLTTIRGTGISSEPVRRVGVNPALTGSADTAGAGIPGEAAQPAPQTHAAATMLPGGDTLASPEARYAAGSLLTFTTE